MKGLDKTCEPFSTLSTTWKSYELMVNFDEQELPPPPPGFTIPAPEGATAATCSTACQSLSNPDYMCDCNNPADLTCICIIFGSGGSVPPIQVDFNNTGFCLEYIQQM